MLYRFLWCQLWSEKSLEFCLVIKDHPALLGKEEEGRELLLGLFFLNCLQLTIILMPKWHILRLYTLTFFSVIIHLSKFIAYTTPKVKPNINYGIWVVTMYVHQLQQKYHYVGRGMLIVERRGLRIWSRGI